MIYDDPTLEKKSHNHREYAGRISNWKEFRMMDSPAALELRRLIDTLLEDEELSPSGAKSATTDLFGWLQSEHPGKTLSEVCSDPSQEWGLPRYFETRLGKKGNRLVDVTNAAKRTTDAFVRQLEIENPGITFYPLITEREVARVRNKTPTKAKATKTRSRPLPEKLFALVKLILDEGEAGWPGRCELFYEDIGGERVYCPVLPTLFRCAMDLPLRVGQFRRLDSGEGDVRQFNTETMEWEANHGPLAGYWADLANKPHKGFPERGFVSELKDGAKVVNGINVNTNKTNDPYVVPWQHEPLLKRLGKMKAWQIERNPITTPVSPEQYLDDHERISAKAKARMPHIFPLFRLFPTDSKNFLGRIPTSGDIARGWLALMAQTQRVWNEDNPKNHIHIVEFDPKTKLPSRAIFNPHGMRVRGLTDLYRAGVPAELLSKFVAGHATITMTIYYLDPLPEELDRLLNRAAVEARSLAAQETMEAFAKAGREAALLKCVSLNPAALDEAGQVPAIMLSNTGCGFCPFDCSRCHDGGPIKRSDKQKNGTAKHVYDRVPGGDRNCILCRHFVSGPAWTVQLELLGTKLCGERRRLALEEQDLSREMAKLEGEHNDGRISEPYYRQTWDDLDTKKRTVAERQEITDNSIFNVELLLRACVDLMSETRDGDGKVPMVSLGDESIVQYTETSEFEHSILQTAASRVYPVFADPAVEAIRNDYLNHMIFEAGIPSPTLSFRTTPEQKRLAMDMFADLVARETSEADRRALADGVIRLQETKILDQVKDLMKRAVDNAIEIPGTQIAHTPILEDASR